MADKNVPAPAPTRSDDQILPFAAWMPIEKSNHLDENWFTLNANLLREALEITPIDQAHPFMTPPSGKTSGHDRPRYPVLQMLWEIITSTNVDFAELMCEEFVQAIQTFLTDKANLASPTKKGRKDKPHVIPYCRFTKLIICEEDEVFGMPIPNELISNNIRNAPYYNAYLEMVAKHDQKVAAEKEGKKKTASAKQPKSKSATEKSKPAQPEPEPEPEPEQEGNGKEYDMERAVQMSLESFQAQGRAHVGVVAIREPVAEATLPLPVVKGKGKAIITKEQVACSLLALHTPKRKITTDQFIFQRRTLATEEESTGPSIQPQDNTSAYKMADENVPAPAPTRSDDQILPFAAWVPIGKSNHVLDLQKRQKNPIFQIAVDILQNTNFFRAFTASASLDEDWFTLDANLLREALEITPIDQAHPFVSPPSGDAIMDFVNELGYPEVIHFVSSMAVNHLYQPWRAILSMINQCLTGKTSGHDRPRYLVLQMLWGIITSTNVDYAELMWEEFVQAMQTFLTNKANLGSPTKKGRKDKPHVIPYCRFMKLIICHLGRIHNIYQRLASLFHLAKEDLRLGNLKFVSKGKEDEVFGMPIPNELISNNIRNVPYYNAYLEMVAKHDQKVAAKKEGKKKTASAKQPKSKSATEKSSKPAPASKPKPAKEKPSKPSTAKSTKPKHAKEKSTKATPLQKAGKGKVAKFHNVKSSFQLVDEPDEEPAQHEPEPEPEQEGKGEEYDMERAIQMSLESFQAQGHAHVGGVAIREPVAEATRPLLIVEGKGKAIVTEEQAAHSLLALHTPKRKSTTDQFIFQRRTLATEEASTGPSTQPQDDTSANIVCDSPSPADAEIGVDTDRTNSGGDTEIMQFGDEQGDDVTEEVNLEDKTTEINKSQAGSDPGKTPESRPPPDDNKMDEDQAGPDPGESRVALAGPDPEPTHDEFMADLYPKVHESLKFLADEHVILEDPPSSTGTLSSMKNLEDAYTIGDQFFNDKSTKDEPGKLNVEAEVVSMVTVLIYQASSSVPPMSTPVIDLSPPKPAPFTTQTLVFTATTSTTTTIRPLPPLPQQQSTTDSELVARVTALEQKFAVFEQKSKNLDNATQNLGSRVFTLELRDMPHKIDKAVCENVKEAVQIALQAPLRERFRDLPEADMKEMLHQRMFENGSYQSLLEHIALYEALEASMERVQRDKFFAERDKSHKRRRDDQDPPPPLDSYPNAPSSSSKQQSSPHEEQPVKDIPIPNTANILDSEDTGFAHLPKIKPMPEWLKPIPEEDRPATPEPTWVILTSHIPDVVSNWANTLAFMYQAPVKNSLLEKTGDMRTFMNWYCQKMGKTELIQADLEGQAYEVVKAFHPDVVHLQFQMEECHKMLTDQIDWTNPEGDQVRIDISRPLPLSGPPGHVTIQTQFFFNKDLDYLRYGSKGCGLALSISKMKVAHYHDFGLELLILEHMWINEVCTYDISVSYGISHWWLNHQKFYIDRHTVDSSRKVVRTHMRILRFVSIKAYSRYVYDYLKEITLRRADYQEYMIAEKDFKNLYPSDFEDLNLLLLQGHLNHLPGSDKRMLSTAVNLWTRNLVIRQRVEDLQLGIESYQKQLNLTKPGWDATGFEYKHDYTIIESPRAVVFPVSNHEQKIMRFNEIYKFSDGTLTHILEAPD
ncbi:hypothetical protein Tco_0879349 [Tanacetum coccineum]